VTTSSPAGPTIPPLTEQLEFDFAHERWGVYRITGYGPDVDLPDYRPTVEEWLEITQPDFNRRC
jgi:hypothetical protein